MLRFGLLICVCLFFLGCALLFAFGSAGAPCFFQKTRYRISSLQTPDPTCFPIRHVFTAGPSISGRLRSTDTGKSRPEKGERDAQGM